MKKNLVIVAALLVIAMAFVGCGAMFALAGQTMNTKADGTGADYIFQTDGKLIRQDPPTKGLLGGTTTYDPVEVGTYSFNGNTMILVTVTESNGSRTEKTTTYQVVSTKDSSGNNVVYLQIDGSTKYSLYYKK